MGGIYKLFKKKVMRKRHIIVDFKIDHSVLLRGKLFYDVVDWF